MFVRRLMVYCVRQTLLLSFYEGKEIFFEGARVEQEILRIEWIISSNIRVLLIVII
jgi:hypothetical protein